MARHAASKNQRRALVRVGLTVAAAGAALGVAGTGAAQAAPAASAQGLSVGDALGSALPGALGPVKTLQLDPLANTGVDPLDNAVGTQIADFKPLSTASVTDPLTDGGALEDLPLVGRVAGLIPG